MKAINQQTYRETLEKGLDSIFLVEYQKFKQACIDQILNSSTSMGFPKGKEINTAKSFKLQNNHPVIKPVIKGAITDLFNSLKKHHFINDNTALPNFRNAFSGSGVENKIIWIGSEMELRYFIRHIKPSLMKCNRWKVCTSCFVSKNGIEFNSDKLRGTIKPGDITKNRIKEIELCCYSFLLNFK